MSRILLVEDEEHLALGLRFNLENAGYEVELARSGPAAIEFVLAGEALVDLVILDVMLPGLSGFDVARAIRKAGTFVPIIMLTARDLMEDRVQGIDAGADDYLTKPFDLDELLARVRGLLRRQVWSRREEADTEVEQETTSAQTQAVLRFGPCIVDFQTHTATTHDGKSIDLSSREIDVMSYFAANEGEVITRARFLEEVWGEPATLETRTIDNFILRLRKYFEPNPKRPRHILSVRGHGYRFVR